MDVAIAIEVLVPNADYHGSVTSNTEEDYDNITWLDERIKPTWSDLEVVWIQKDNELKWDEIRKQRSYLLNKHKWRIERYQTQIAINITPTESAEKIADICQYFQDLRDITETFQTPAQVVWPTEP